MSTTSTTGRSRIDHRFLIFLAIAFAVAVFAIAWVSIRQSQSDSYRLLEEQGKAFTEALAQASENAIVSETIYDHFAQTRYNDLVTSLAAIGLDQVSDQQLVSFGLTHDLAGIYIFDDSSQLVQGVTTRGPRSPLPQFVQEEVAGLLDNPEANYVLLLDTESAGGDLHYYLEVASSLDYVTVLAVDALYYSDALEQTGIGFLVQRMAREAGVEYIIYQSSEGIVLSSRRVEDMLAIESDPFLVAALEADSIASREFSFQDRQVLELVRPFSSGDFPFGLFRVGLSLDGYFAVNRGFNIQIATLSGVLFVLLLVILLYLDNRRKRWELSRQYTDIKSITDRLFEQMRTGVAAVDGSGNFRLANRAFEEVFGVSDIVGQSWSDVLPKAGRMLERTKSGNDRNYETELSVTVGNEERTILLAKSTLSEGETSGGSVLVAYNITRVREFERQSQRKERLSEMGNLAAGVAHEIRNPLNTISIAAQRLAGEFTPDDNLDQYRAFTSQIRTETKRLNDIITRFLALAREGKKSHTTIDLCALLSEVKALLVVEGERLGVSVELSCEPGLTLTGDRDRFKEVFLNLFNNTKEALAGAKGEVAITARRNDEVIEISFVDNGPGIVAAAAEKVFTPYYTTKEAGTGLGLPTIQRTIVDLGGDITLDTAKGDGARFVISLPASSP